VNSSEKHHKFFVENEPNLIPVGSKPLDLRMFPDFFCIGPQRTGSTWLHSNLIKHPEILMHRDKETFFFSTLGRPDLPRFHYQTLEGYLASFRDTVEEKILKNYHAIRRCGCLYRPSIIGESTASYCLIGDEVISEIIKIKPGLKVVMLIRDPLDRAWSHAKKDLVRDALGQASPDDFLAFCGSTDQLQRADYNGILERWTRFLKPDHFLIIPADRIEQDPEQLITQVLKFLNAKMTMPASRRHVSTKQNKTKNIDIPLEIKGKLENMLAPYIDSYTKLRDLIGDGKIF
jgi:hypothetical protein